MWNMLSILIALLVLFFCIPLKFDIQYINGNVKIKTYIYYYICILNKKINVINKLKNIKLDTDTINKYSIKAKKYFFNKIIKKIVKELYNKIKFKRIYLNLSLNKNIFYRNYILSAYIYSIMCSKVFMSIAKDKSKYDIDNLNINLELKEKTNIEFKCIININIANIIYIIIKNILKEYLLCFWKRGKNYVRA